MTKSSLSFHRQEYVLASAFRRDRVLSVAAVLLVFSAGGAAAQIPTPPAAPPVSNPVPPTALSPVAPPPVAAPIAAPAAAPPAPAAAPIIVAEKGQENGYIIHQTADLGGHLVNVSAVVQCTTH